MKKSHPLISKNTSAIVFSRMQGPFENKPVNLTTIDSDGNWISGMNYITNMDDMCDIAENHGLSLVPECLVKMRMK